MADAVETNYGSGLLMRTYHQAAERMTPLVDGGMHLEPTTHTSTEPAFEIGLSNPYEVDLPGHIDLDHAAMVGLVRITLAVEFHAPFFTHDVNQIQLKLYGDLYLDWTDLNTLALTPPWPTGSPPLGTLTARIRGSYSHPGHPLPHSGLTANSWRALLWYPVWGPGGGGGGVG